MEIDNLSSSQQTHTCLSHAAFAVAVSSHLAIWNSIYPKREKKQNTESSDVTTWKK